MFPQTVLITHKPTAQITNIYMPCRVDTTIINAIHFFVQKFRI